MIELMENQEEFRERPSGFTYEIPRRRAEYSIRSPDPGPNFRPGFVGLYIPGPDLRFTLSFVERLDPVVLDSRLALFEEEHGRTFGRALEEVRAGRKERDWIWSVFPQASGLPKYFNKPPSGPAKDFSIDYLDEAVAFLEHPVLGKNYFEIVEEVRKQLDQRGLKEIFNPPGMRDAKKVVSSVTLFRRAARASRMQHFGLAGTLEGPPATVDEGDGWALGDVIDIDDYGWDDPSQRRRSRVQIVVPPQDLDPPWRGSAVAVAEPGLGLVSFGSIFPAPSKCAAVLIDHCNAILAKADDEGLAPCEYSENFDPAGFASDFLREDYRRSYM